MLVDDSLIKSLNIAVRPEFLISDSIWTDWFNAVKETEFYNKKIIEVARLKRRFWPPIKSEENFGFYLNMRFSDVKNLLGNDAKKTLIICLAEELKKFYADNLEEVCVNDDIKINHDKCSIGNDGHSNAVSVLNSKSEFVLQNLEIAIRHIEVLEENSQASLIMINKLKECILINLRENKDLSEGVKEKDRNIRNMKVLMEELTKMSQGHIIDIDNLKRENKNIKSELEDYKEKYTRIKLEFDDVKIDKININSKKFQEKYKNNSLINQVFVDREKSVSAIDSQVKFQHRSYPMKHESERENTTYDADEDIKI